MDRESKTLRRRAVLEDWVNRFTRQALRETEDVRRKILKEMFNYTLKHSASQEKLHSIFYN